MRLQPLWEYQIIGSGLEKPILESDNSDYDNIGSSISQGGEKDFGTAEAMVEEIMDIRGNDELNIEVVQATE